MLFPFRVTDDSDGKIHKMKPSTRFDCPPHSADAVRGPARESKTRLLLPEHFDSQSLNRSLMVTRKH
jgi:hypothetical protein